MTAHHTPKKFRRTLILSAALLALSASVGVQVATAPAAQANPVYQIIDADNDPYSGIYLRWGTDMNNVDRIATNYVVYGTSAELLCGAWGTAVGPNANRRWHQVRLTNGSNAGRTGWMADRYMSTPNAANQLTPGEPECGASAPTPAPTTTTAPLVWAGSPIDALWDGGEPADGPATHHFLYNPAVQADFAVDLSLRGTNRDVITYIAPNTSGVAITTRVDQIGEACRYGGGAKFVTVGIYSGSVKVGVVTYGHINPMVSVGQTINRWGTKVGTVATGLTKNAACWTGAHVHMEMQSTKNYACYNKGFSHNQLVARSNFVGFTGGNVASGIRKACA